MYIAFFTQMNGLPGYSDTELRAMDCSTDPTAVETTRVRQLLHLICKLFSEWNVCSNTTSSLIKKHAVHDKVHDEIYIEKQYTCGGYLSVSAGDTVVDVGAHVGLFALWCVNRGQASRVL